MSDKELRGLLKECADDLEAELRHRYTLNDGSIHPMQQRRFDRDMDVVVRARAALTHEGGITAEQRLYAETGVSSAERDRGGEKGTGE